MILTDAGPLVAILNRNDQHHDRCVRALSSLEYPLVTTWPALTEAMYFLGEHIGWTAQEKLWRLLLRDDVILAPLNPSALARMRALMGKYQDTPMDLADASLVAAAETMDQRRIFSLDTDFRVYRVNNRSAFEIVP